MRRRLLRLFATVSIVAIVLSLLVPATALAHEQRDVGKYHFVAGWIVEPAFEGIKNGVDLRVSATDGQKPVEGLEQTLQVEITHVPSNTSKAVSLRTIFRDPGHYTYDLIPTASGVYRFRVFGIIEGTQINETFVSRGGGGGFGDIEPSKDLQFPVQLPEVREIQGVTRGAQSAAEQAQDVALKADDSASLARTLSIVGIALGGLGLVAGVASIAAVRRKK
ncbi:MAG: hypothetical protein HYX97_04820 [Chloroflexi bacterium]|nr:hypothetical protein [Chloroflexota bacterium]